MTNLIASLPLNFFGSGKPLSSISPINGETIGSISTSTSEDYERTLTEAHRTFLKWRELPAPKRGEIVRQIGLELRQHKAALGALITLEMGKILAEGEGEVQEAIDIADFAVGLSRQLYGLSMHSERPSHRMYEQWHPLGVVGVISAFNFPMAVWAWNAMLAAVCGDTVLWKPSEHTPLCAVAINNICQAVATRHGFSGLFNLVVGADAELGKKIAEDPRVPLVSATGSCRMGRSVGETVGRRLGRTILELGGNNAVIVLKDADLDLVVRAVAFGAAGTAGQRCTSIRRVLIERSIEKEFVAKLTQAYKQIRIGDPREAGILMGPLVNQAAVDGYSRALLEVRKEGGEIVYGGELAAGKLSTLYVTPTIVRARAQMAIVKEETFAPILYVIAVDSVEQAIEINNAVPQGLSSAIFTRNLQHSERFLSAAGSDCGIANVNIGTSGAEIGGAFGGEKDTGGGRESGSDAWKQYMRRQTSTINWGNDLPLAQGIKFDL
ncbi:MAG: aldehyde dehydrogenase family protein [Oligoflexia bacterium]|nr:aldehyde dehydrogenase family protein [Oligoflexia bacterium]